MDGPREKSAGWQVELIAPLQDWPGQDASFELAVVFDHGF